MKRLVVAGMMALAASCGFQAVAHSAPLWVPGAPVKAGESNLPVIRVQSATMEVQQLQEQIRSLNGRIEEMSYQLLQMQEQIRKFQEDNEFRFQEIERKGGNANKKSGSLETPSQKPADDVARIIEEPGAASGSGQAPATDGNTTAATGTTGGKPAMELGSIEMDAGGNPVGATINKSGENASAPLSDSGSASSGEVASLSGKEGQDYQAAYGHVLSGDYSVAEKEFQDYIASYPSSAKAADANFWLGEAFYSQGKYNEAAKTFLNAHKSYGKSPKAPEMLLKLGMSLAALDNKDMACATLREVPKRYPKASRAVIGKVAAEQKRLAC